MAKLKTNADAERLQIALAAANSIGTWDWDVASGLVRADARVCEFYGVDPADAAAGAPATEFEQRIHPDDMPRYRETIATAVRNGAAFAADYRVLQPDGSVRWVSAQARAARAADGRTARFTGVAVDVTERKATEAALRESEERFRLVADSAPVMLWMGDQTGKCIYLNKAQRDFWGVSEDTVANFQWISTVHPDDLGALTRPFEQAMQTHVGFKVEARYRRAEDGCYRTLSTQAQPRFQSDGAFLGMIGVNVDVTEARQTEAVRRAETRRLQILNRTGAIIAAELDLGKIVQTIVDACVELTGAQFGAFFYNVLDDKGESYMLYALSGVPREAFSKFPMPRATAVFQPTFKGEGIVRSDDILKDARYGKSGPHFGMPPGHLPVRSYLAAPVIARSGEVLGGLFFGHADAGVFKPEHEDLLLGIAGQAAVAIDNSRLFQSAASELAERRRAEQALQSLNASLETQIMQRTTELRATAQRQRTTFQTSYIYQGYMTRDGILLDANAASLAGIEARLEDVVGRPFWETPWFVDTPGMPDAVRDAVTRAAEGQAVEQSIALKLPTGDRAFDFALRPVKNDRGEVIAIVPEAVETTERLKVEEQLRQAQKMEAVGQLTGGIAHDFNNMMAVVIGALNLLQRRLTKGDTDVGRYIEAATEGATRAAALTQRLLAFSRQQPLAPEPIDANRMVADMSKLLARTLGEQVKIATELEGGLWRTHADPLQLENVLLNLAVNARDAMPEGGSLTIATSNTEIDGRAARQYEIAAGEYILISVNDTGAGMPPEVAAQAFDPFFTTKDVGAGTGLGLSQVFGFVRQSGGHVELASQVGVGTTVNIFLPRFHGETAPAASKPQAVAPSGRPSEVVLVVEDELRVRNYSVEALRELGYSVVHASTAQQALRKLDEEPEVTLLFTDVIMPGISGRKLAELALAKRPALKVLFTTGYSRDAIGHDAVLDAGTHILPKPFSIDQLATKIRSVLDG